VTNRDGGLGKGKIEGIVSMWKIRRLPDTPSHVYASASFDIMRTTHANAIHQAINRRLKGVIPIKRPILHIDASQVKNIDRRVSSMQCDASNSNGR
jgi:hypothetical protein